MANGIRTGAADALYNFDVHFGLLAAFGALKPGLAPNMTRLVAARDGVRRAYPPASVGLLVNFLDNHDTPRFAGSQPDLSQYL
jgi:hypothetical protein